MDTEPASHQHEQLLNTLKHASVCFSEAASRYDRTLKARNDAIHAAFDAGVSSSDIADITGITRQRLSTIRNRKN